MHFSNLARQFITGTAVFAVILGASGLLRLTLGNYRYLTDLGPSTVEQGIVQSIHDDGSLVGMCGKMQVRFGALRNGTHDRYTPIEQFHCISDINDSRHMVGTLSTSAGLRAAIWTSEGGLMMIDPGGVASCGYGLNNMGEIVGCYWTSAKKPKAFLWSAERGVVDLSKQIGTDVAFAKDVNDRGIIVGQLGSEEFGQAFCWDPVNGLCILDNAGANSSCANGINDRGLIVGHYEYQGRMHACLWTDSNSRIDLNELLPPGSQWELQAAWAINDRDQVVGYGAKNGQPHDFLLDVTSVDQKPATLPQILAKS